ncbi:MAG: ADP-ribose diphosphatase [Gammaproteobacteria bacterium]|nr:ADP-ribose diphosphatase [Gammaproteobacteria bacterium]
MSQQDNTATFTLLDVEVLEHRCVYQGFFQMQQYRLRHRLFAGGWSEVMSRELFERGHAVVVMPYDPLRDKIVLLEQFRIGAMSAPGGPWLLEFVAGMYKEGEDALDVARREVKEEMGCEVAELEFITEYLVSPGGTSERISLYCGRVDASQAEGIHGLDEEHEDIRVSSASYDEAVRLLEQGRINSAAPIIALQWLQSHRQRLRRQWGALS